jgi:hypothetical protein
MAFNNTVLETQPDLMAGEVIASAPHSVSAFEVWEEGLVPGRFVKYASGSIDLLDVSATPVIAGVVRRKIASAIENATYTKLGIAPDQVAEVCNFGFVTVEVPAGVTPAKFGQVYAVNIAGADIGKATTVPTSNVAVPGCVFWEAKAANTWLVLVPKYLTGV